MRTISAIAIVIAAITTGSVVGMQSASHVTMQAATGQCPGTMVWDGNKCI